MRGHMMCPGNISTRRGPMPTSDAVVRGRSLPPPSRSRGPGRRRLRWLAAAGLALMLTPGLHAQDSVIVIDPDAPINDTTIRYGLPPEILQEVVTRFNADDAIRLQGDVDLPSGSRLDGQIALFRGVLTVSGQVSGRLTVINGDLVIEPGGVVTGEVLVVGGRFDLAPGAKVDGPPRVFPEAAPVLRNSAGLLVVRDRRRTIRELGGAQRSFRTGQVRTTVFLSGGGTYNRIEGLPITLGPRFDWKVSSRTQARLEFAGIVRTAPDQSNLRQDFGYSGRLEWRFGGRRGIGVGLHAAQVVTAIADQPLSRAEAGWSAFLLQRDPHDYYLNEGYGAYFYAHPGSNLRVEASLRRDLQTSVRARDPWSLLRNSDSWRPNPLVDDGHFVTLGLGFDLDTRNSEDFTTSGWWIHGLFERGTGKDLAPVDLPATIRPPLDGNQYAFNRAGLDARKYFRLSPGARVSARLLAAGWAGGDPLPVQRRLALGGPDLLPGYSFHALTCGGAGFANAAQAGYCDRMFAMQLEYRSRLDIGLGYRFRDRERGQLEQFVGVDQADLVFFADAGDAWLSGTGPGRVPNDRIPRIDEWKSDVGVGIDAGGLGIYLAKALTDGEPLRLTIRLQRRF